MAHSADPEGDASIFLFGIRTQALDHQAPEIVRDGVFLYTAAAPQLPQTRPVAVKELIHQTLS